MSNRSLHNAKTLKNDEFYTQLKTIESELVHYKEHFKNKIVYLNCDDPRESQFFAYFLENFYSLGLKRLIASCYKSQEKSLLDFNKTTEPAVYIIYDGWLIDGRSPKVREVSVSELKGDGDFRSKESVELLKQADIVVTNPPFSLFRDFIAQMIEYDKQFLILGSINAITYKEFFPLIRRELVWPGTGFRGSVEFMIPGDSEIESKSGRVDHLGHKFTTVQGVTWWTNMEYAQRKQDLELKVSYQDKTQRVQAGIASYDNLEGINVNKVADIPYDYSGIMGVPITFLGKWNPEQFEVVGLGDGNGLWEHKSFVGISKEWVDKYRAQGGKGDVTPGDAKLVYYDANGLAVRPYTRILIKNKKVRGLAPLF